MAKEKFSPTSGNPLREQSDGTFKDDLTQDVFTEENLKEVGKTASNSETDVNAGIGAGGTNYANGAGRSGNHPNGKALPNPLAGSGNPTPEQVEERRNSGEILEEKPARKESAAEKKAREENEKAAADKAQAAADAEAKRKQENGQ